MNNIFVSWKQKIESRIISDLKSQYTESEEQIRQRKEQFLKKQKKIILIEIIAGAVFLAFLIIRAAFLQDDILLSRNSFGQGSKEVQLSLKKDDKKKEITYKLDEQKLSAEEESKLIKSLKFVHFKKGESVDGQNELLKNMIFLIRGSARTYYIERGCEHNFAFTFASHFLIRPETIIRSGHHHIIIKFMELSDVCYVPLPDLNLLDKSRQGEVFKYISLGLSSYADFLEEQMVMLHKPARERYQWALERYPNILDLVTVTQLASFLNLTKETIYRIRSGKY